MTNIDCDCKGLKYSSLCEEDGVCQECREGISSILEKADDVFKRSGQEALLDVAKILDEAVSRYGIFATSIVMRERRKSGGCDWFNYVSASLGIGGKVVVDESIKQQVIDFARRERE